MRKATVSPKPKAPDSQVSSQCVCGAVRLEIDVPVFLAWHDHSARSRHAQGCAYATYLGCYKSRVRILHGGEKLTRYEDAEHRTARSFCSRCGAPVLYERGDWPAMVNIPRALFAERTDREPRYHTNMVEQADWTYLGEPLGPLKGYPGVLRERPRKKKARAAFDPMF